MFTPVFGKQIEIGGRKVHYLEAGEGLTTVVLLHGFASLAQEIAAPFDASNPVTFLAFDRPGYGYSDALGGPQTGGPASQARWLADALDALGRTNCIIVAHSMGAGPALWLAARRPDLVSRLLLLAPFCRPTRKRGETVLHAAMQPGIGPLLTNLLMPAVAGRLGPLFLRSALHPNAVPAHLADFPFAHAGRRGALRALAHDYLGFQRDMVDFDRSQSLRTRIKVVFGAEDRIAVPDWHLDWLDGLRTPFDVQIMPGVGHAPHHVRADAVHDALATLL